MSFRNWHLITPHKEEIVDIQFNKVNFNTYLKKIFYLFELKMVTSNLDSR